jgi:hypothetical protein
MSLIVDVAHVDEAGRDPGHLLQHEQPGEVCGRKAVEVDAPAAGRVGHRGQKALKRLGLAGPDRGPDRQGDLVGHGPTPTA